MKAYVELSGENDDASCTIYAFFESERILFECGEGTQRFVHGRNGIVLSKVKSIYLTSLSWESIGGLIGFMLTHVDPHDHTINLIGPKGLQHVLASSRDFQGIQGINMTEITMEDMNREFVDQSSKVTVLPICRESGGDMLLCYIGSTTDIKGKFYPDRAIKLGVPKGKDFSKLQNGESVVSATTGLPVHPTDVMDPVLPGSKFLVIRCPSPDYFRSLFSLAKLNDSNVKFTCIFHIVPAEVLRCPEYVEFIARLSTNNSTAELKVRHVIVNNENCEYYPSFAGSDRQVSQLKTLVPNLFNYSEDERSVEPLASTLIESLPSDIKQMVMPCQKITRIHLAPKPILGNLEITTINDNEIDQAGTDNLDFFFSEQGKQIKSELDHLIKQVEDSTEAKRVFPKVLFTGTSSAIPSKFRNVTGNYIELPEKKGILLDAGEGTFGQMFRFFGPNKVREHVLGVELIWVSHMHADHHLGIPRILQKQMEYSTKHNIMRPLTMVVGPAPLIRWLEELSKVSPMQFTGIVMDEQPGSDLFYQLCLERLGISAMTYVPVIHCNGAYGVVIDFLDGFRLTYSGDTRPCHTLAVEGSDSSLLIHEATFEDDKQPDAMAKRHSTTGEALTIGKEMDAKFVLLTHFSSRYPTLPTTNADITNYGLAFDLLAVSPYQYPLFQKILKPLDSFFTHEIAKKEAEKQLLSQSLPPPKKKASEANNATTAEDKEQKQNERLEKYYKKHKHVKKTFQIVKLNMSEKSFKLVDTDQSSSSSSSGNNSPINY